MNALQRITIEFVAREDRIRLSGARADEGPLAIWLTKRLLDRLVPVLLESIEREASDLPAVGQGDGGGDRAARSAEKLPYQETLQGFAQQAARNRLEPQRAVRVSSDDEAWLAATVSVSRSPRWFKLTFKAADGRSASATLNIQQMRQWLNILHDSYRRAEWPLAVWPDWVREAGASVQGAQSVRH